MRILITVGIVRILVAFRFLASGQWNFYDGSGIWNRPTTALLSEEGSGIAKRIPRGVVPRRNLPRFALEPPRRAIF